MFAAMDCRCASFVSPRNCTCVIPMEVEYPEDDFWMDVDPPDDDCLWVDEDPPDDYIYMEVD